MDMDYFPLIKNLILSPITPVKPEDTAADPDIISSLYLKGYSLVLKKILDYLSQSDLLNCLLVYSHWKSFCNTLKPISDRLPAKLNEVLMTQKQDENQVVKNVINKQWMGRVTMLAIRKSNLPPQTQSCVSNKLSPKRTISVWTAHFQLRSTQLIHAKCSRCLHSFCPLCLGKAHRDDLRCAKKISPSERHLYIAIKEEA